MAIKRPKPEEIVVKLRQALQLAVSRAERFSVACETGGRTKRKGPDPKVQPNGEVSAGK